MYLETEDWRELGEERASAAMGHTSGERVTELLTSAVLDLKERMLPVIDAVEGREREAFDSREAALKAAREHVNGLPSEAGNARGYHDSALNPERRVALELQIARYLLDIEE